MIFIHLYVVDAETNTREHEPACCHQFV